MSVKDAATGFHAAAHADWGVAPGLHEGQILLMRAAEPGK